jgi:SAM-dependent methyltransferase
VTAWCPRVASFVESGTVLRDQRPNPHPGRPPHKDDDVQAKGTFACVVDEHPRFHLDALRWFASLTAIAGVDPRDLVIHVVGSDESDALVYLRSCGVTMRPVDPFDRRSPHCNKVAGALRLAEEHTEGLVVLCDTDVAVLEDPRGLVLPPGSIGGKVVDTPVPPLGVLHEVFAASGMPAPPTTPLPWGEGQSTVVGNSNGGLYLIPAALLPVLAPAWETWARWLLDRRELLRDWTFHLDQVAMVLALTAEAIGSEQLDVRWNTPIHDLTRIPADPTAPAVIHYHQEVDAQGRLRMTGSLPIDRQIQRVNEVIEQLWLKAFPTTTFWRWWNLIDHGVGPGTARPSHSVSTERDLLAEILGAISPASVLHVGCGNGELTKGLPMPGYVGIEGSPEAALQAKSDRSGEVLVGSLADFSVRADLTICLDMLTHESDVSAYRDQVARLWASTDRALVVSGYERTDDTGLPPDNFHEPVSKTLLAVAPEAELYPVRVHQGITTFVVLRPPSEPHPRDIESATLSAVMDRHPDPMTLLALRLDAQRNFGFFPNHAPRIWEYPALVDLIIEHLPVGSSLVDVGAGITPLAPFLTSRGYVVDTVDPSEIHRTWPPTQDWNEWGYLDYGHAGLAHKSWNSALNELPESCMFDGVFSVSVIEHIPATGRRALLKAIAARLRPGGLMVLTVDLTRGGMDLWNRNMDQVVDKPGQHGSFQDLIREARSAGFELLGSELVREWGDVEVDIGLLVMRRQASSRTLWQRTRRALRRPERGEAFNSPVAI